MLISLAQHVDCKLKPYRLVSLEGICIEMLVGDQFPHIAEENTMNDTYVLCQSQARPSSTPNHSSSIIHTHHIRVNLLWKITDCLQKDFTFYMRCFFSPVLAVASFF